MPNVCQVCAGGVWVSSVCLFLYLLYLSIADLLSPWFLTLYLSDLQDFRDAVSRASRQSGKPVIEERLLNQILYSLPQLYELNQDLLRELKDRVAKWYKILNLEYLN